MSHLSFTAAYSLKSEKDWPVDFAKRGGGGGRRSRGKQHRGLHTKALMQAWELDWNVKKDFSSLSEGITIVERLKLRDIQLNGQIFLSRRFTHFQSNNQKLLVWGGGGGLNLDQTGMCH